MAQQDRAADRAVRPSSEKDEAHRRRIPIILKALGALGIVAGAGVALLMGLLIVALVVYLQHTPIIEGVSTATLIIFVSETVLSGVLAVMFVVLGVRLILDKRRHAALLAEAMTVVIVGVGACEIMLGGLGLDLIPYAVAFALLTFMTGYLDPSLAEERELQRKLRDLETREQAEEGTLGRDTTGKGYLTLNFFNLFWIFVVASVLGLAIEAVYHFFVVVPGEFQDRAGLLFGPFSPIYGIGAVLMTCALNRFHRAPIIVVFLVSAVIGGAFEYVVSWFMQFAFGIVAWDYTGTFLSIDGRTNGMFMAMWGVLGVLWVKLLLPRMLQLVNLIPWKWRYTVTTVCATLMIIDCAMTLVSYDRWYERMAGNVEADNAIGQFFDRHFDDAYMADRFQSMSINPDEATRAK